MIIGKSFESPTSLIRRFQSLHQPAQILFRPSGVLVEPFVGTGPQWAETDGQSLAQGQVGGSGITTTNPFGAPTPVDSSNLLSISEGAQERPVSAALFQIRNADATRLLIGGSNGVSGNTIEALRGPSTHWTNFVSKISTVNGTHPTAQMYGINWFHGNANQANDSGVYKTQLEAYHSEVNAAIQSGLSGQGTRNVQMWLMQLGAGTDTLTTRDFSYVPYDMWDAYIANPQNFRIVGPMYKYVRDTTNPYLNNDVHYSAAAYQQAAELVGEAQKQTYVDGTLWEPLQISSAVYRGSNEILITYSEDISIDTTNVVAAPSAGPTLWGLYLEDPNPQPAVILSVATSGSNGIVATLSKPPGTDSKIWTGRESRRGAFAGDGNTASSWGSMRTNIHTADTAIVTGATSTLTQPKWAALQHKAVTGTVAPASTNGTNTLDFPWKAAWGAQDSNPSSGGDWAPLVGSVSLPLLTGTLTANQSTTGLADAAIGSSLVDEGFDLSSEATSAAYRITNTTDLSNTFDLASGRFVFRYIGDIQRLTAGGNRYLLNVGPLTGGPRIIILATTAGNISVTIQTSLGTRTHAVAAIMPASSTLGMIDVCIQHDFQQRLEILICANGTVSRSTASAFGVGDVIGARASVLCADNGSARWNPALVSFLGVATGHYASSWTPELYEAQNALL